MIKIKKSSSKTLKELTDYSQISWADSMYKPLTAEDHGPQVLTRGESPHKCRELRGPWRIGLMKCKSQREGSCEPLRTDYPKLKRTLPEFKARHTRASSAWRLIVANQTLSPLRAKSILNWPFSILCFHVGLELGGEILNRWVSDVSTIGRFWQKNWRRCYIRSALG